MPLKKGWRVRALSRNTLKPAAQALAKEGAEVVPGDLDNPSELAAAFEGVYGVFSVQNYWLTNVGFDGEIRQGKALADIAQTSNVQHLVYSSVGGAHRGMGQKHFKSKFLVEQHIQSIGIQYTILRPAAFMENALWNLEKILEDANPSWGLPPQKTVQTIAVQDIAAFAVLRSRTRNSFWGKPLNWQGMS